MTYTGPTGDDVPDEAYWHHDDETLDEWVERMRERGWWADVNAGSKEPAPRPSPTPPPARRRHRPGTRGESRTPTERT